jgi:DNA-binding GntR family transcriptional regulator
MTQEYHVGRETIHMAAGVLRSEGLVSIARGRGTTVRSRR